VKSEDIGNYSIGANEEDWNDYGTVFLREIAYQLALMNETRESDRSDRLTDLAVKLGAAKRAVETWMREQAQCGRLVTNGQSPHWPDYEKAQREFDEELERVQAGRAA
jgi:hypothetical protein